MSSTIRKVVVGLALLVGFSTFSFASPTPASATKAVHIPSNYVYRPSNPPHGDKSLHDYCTSSPDQYLWADFRGACARHDMCFDFGWQSRQGCNNTFRSNLRAECLATYPSWWQSPARSDCYGVADIYWAAVTAKTIWDGRF